MTTQVFKSFKDFNNRADKSVNGVSPQFAELHPDYVADNETNKGCYNCTYCINCIDCHGCGWCYNCHGCHDQSEPLPLHKRIWQTIKSAYGRMLDYLFGEEDDY